MADQFKQHGFWECTVLENQFDKVDAINKSLKEAILNREKSEPGIKRSNARMTWHSKYDMKDWCGDAFKDLMTMFNDQFTAMATIYGAVPGSDMKLAITPWAMVQHGGDYATPHTHPNAHFSAVYYVAAGPMPGKYPESGNLELFDPRQASQTLQVPGLSFSQRVLIPPKAGKMLTFPAWLGHMVHPSTGGGERIAIAANCRITKYTRKEA